MTTKEEYWELWETQSGNLAAVYRSKAQLDTVLSDYVQKYGNATAASFGVLYGYHEPARCLNCRTSDNPDPNDCRLTYPNKAYFPYGD